VTTCPFGTRRTRRWIPWLSISIPALGWLVFVLYPSIATIYYSLTQYSGVPGASVNYCGLCNYRAAFTGLSSQTWESLKVTIVYTVGVTVLQIVIGLGLALLLNRRGRMFGLYRALVFMPQIFSVTIVAALFSLIFDPISGPAEKILQNTFHVSSAFLGNSSIALPLIIGINVWMFAGYTMLIYIAGLRRIPPELYEAASMDGCGRWNAFRRITWPMLAAATTVNVFLTAMGCLGEYALILLLTDGHFGTKTIGMYMFDQAFGMQSQLGYGSMLAMLQFAMTLVIGGVLLFTLRRREIQL
jgi:raffinose/stachyose/melibiose transport system permease protein